MSKLWWKAGRILCNRGKSLACASFVPSSEIKNICSERRLLWSGSRHVALSNVGRCVWLISEGLAVRDWEKASSRWGAWSRQGSRPPHSSISSPKRWREGSLWGGIYIQTIAVLFLVGKSRMEWWSQPKGSRVIRMIVELEFCCVCETDDHWGAGVGVRLHVWSGVQWKIQGRWKSILGLSSNLSGGLKNVSHWEIL